LYFVLTVCLISIGLLLGWVLSAWAGKDAWVALGAIGSWVGGLGALAAAAAALYISHRQEKRDTHKLYIEAYDIQSDVTFTNVGDRPSGHFKIIAYNSGFRPIELVKLVFVHEFGEGHLQITDCVVEAGRRSEWEYKNFITFISGKHMFSIYSNRLLDGDIKVMDATGIYHEVDKVN
jgi:hypothetical protein